MKIQTLSVVVGNNSCNAKCAFCVSKMTGKSVLCSSDEYDYRNLDKTCRFSQQNGVSTALITGKGEPTLSDEIYNVCEHLNKYFPFIELQTNGSLLDQEMLCRLYNAGLTTVIISMVHYHNKKNNEIYGYKNPLDLKATIDMIHNVGLSVRLSCIMVKGYIDSMKEVETLIKFCKENKVEQLTIRPVETPKITKHQKTWEWTEKHKVDEWALKQINTFIKLHSVVLMNLTHGAVIYDFQGQNICVSNCLTMNANDETIRQLIIYPNGHVYYDWQYEGAILL